MPGGYTIATLAHNNRNRSTIAAAARLMGRGGLSVHSRGAIAKKLKRCVAKGVVQSTLDHITTRMGE